MPLTIRSKAEKLMTKHGVLRTRDFEEAGIPRWLIPELVEDGSLLRNARGVYTSVKASVSENHSLAQVAKIAPHAVICLISALRFHELTTESPREVWLALPPNSRSPRIDMPPIHAVRFSGESFSQGIEERLIDRVPVRIYSPAKTVVDCFKFRNQIGKNIAVEALRDAWRKKSATADELWRYAEVCRVLEVMRPYFDAMIR